MAADAWRFFRVIRKSILPRKGCASLGTRRQQQAGANDIAANTASGHEIDLCMKISSFKETKLVNEIVRVIFTSPGMTQR